MCYRITLCVSVVLLYLFTVSCAWAVAICGNDSGSFLQTYKDTIFIANNINKPEVRDMLISRFPYLLLFFSMALLSVVLIVRLERYIMTVNWEDFKKGM